MKTRTAAQLLHGQFEGELGAQGGFFEQHADVLAVQGVRVVARRGLDLGGEVEQVDQFVVGQVEVVEKVVGIGFQDLVRSKHGNHGRASLNVYSL